MRTKNILMLFLVFVINMAFGQSSHQLLRNGDQMYQKGEYNKAEIDYRKADEAKPTMKSKYNQGNAIYMQNRYDEAIKRYLDAENSASSDQDKADIYYNLGNAYYQNKNYKESIDAYKKSLGYKPDDIQTKENLALARREMKKVQQQNQQDQQQKENKDKQENQQNQDSPNQQNQDNPKDGPDNKDNNKNQQSHDQNNEDKNNTSMSKEEAKKLLEIMDEEEKKVQQNMRRSGERSRPRKNW